MVRVGELEGSAKSPGFQLASCEGECNRQGFGLARQERLEQMVLGYLESLIILALTSWCLLT
jgi:hypothetical protein